jgi:hypothetical protein
LIRAGTTCTSINKIRKGYNNNIGPNNNTKVSFLDGLPDIWSDTSNKFTDPTQNLPVGHSSRRLISLLPPFPCPPAEIN